MSIQGSLVHKVVYVPAWIHDAQGSKYAFKDPSQIRQYMSVQESPVHKVVYERTRIPIT